METSIDVMQQTVPYLSVPALENLAVQDYYNYKLIASNTAQLVEMRNQRKAANKGDIVYELISPDGIHFWYCNTTVGKKKSIIVENAEPFFHFNFVVRNNSEYKLRNCENAFATFKNHEYNVIFFPEQESQIDWQPTDRVEAFELNIVPSFLRKYLPENHPIVTKILNAEKRKTPLAISDENMPITPQLMGILLDILNCPLESEYKRMYLKAKVIELLSVVLSQWGQFVAPQTCNGLRQMDINRMQAARELLHANLQSPCSIIDLAHQVGTNENYLKKQFKMLFGNTVFGYVQDLRMQRAKLMLQEERPIIEIARTIGYKNVHHFSTAFKKFFGYSPYAIKTWILSMLLEVDFEAISLFGL